ncbi:hypothetical protein AAG906_024040 [Vitis piasezkii]
MTTSINAKCLLKPTKRKTLLFQANEEHSIVITPVEIPWESLTHSNTWNFTQLALPKPIQIRKPLFITQNDKGNVTNSRISIQESRTFSPPRQSFKVNSRRPFVKLDNIDFRLNIPHPRYVMQESSPPTSPTPSQMLPPNEPHQLMEKDPQINRIVHKFKQQTRTRNYYPKPTLPDLQYEERSQIVQSKYDGDDIYEWNINGVSDHQVLNILQEMIMASTTYKSRGNSDQTICTHLIARFTGQLKGWKYTLPKYIQEQIVTNPIGKNVF